MSFDLATEMKRVEQSAQAIKEKLNSIPEVGIILGSGLGSFVDRIENQTVIPYEEIVNFHSCTVAGHSGRLIAGTIEGVPVLAMQGRFHAYEGHPIEDVVLPVRTMGMLGVKKLFLTNAAGGVNLNYKAGELVVIEDHINLMGTNPLIGKNDDKVGTRFPDMSYAYAPELKEMIIAAAKDLGVDIKTGVYAGVLGPSYETPAEVRMIRILGGDMVGMSTVPETIAANHMGMKVAGISCVSNMAAGVEEGVLKHEDIKEEANKVMEFFTNLLAQSIAKLK